MCCSITHFCFLVQILHCTIFPDLACVCFSHCLLQHFQANSHLISSTENPSTLPIHTMEKMSPERSSGKSFKAVQRSLLQKQILFSLPTQTSLLKSVSKATGMAGFSLGILFFYLSNVFPLPSSQPQPTHPPNSWLYYIK